MNYDEQIIFAIIWGWGGGGGGYICFLNIDLHFLVYFCFESNEAIGSTQGGILGKNIVTYT